jgi:hypothetical protein
VAKVGASVERLLTPKLEAELAEAICSASEYAGMDVPALVKRLRSKGAGALAAKITKTCGP